MFIVAKTVNKLWFAVWHYSIPPTQKKSATLLIVTWRLIRF